MRSMNQKQTPSSQLRKRSRLVQEFEDVDVVMQEGYGYAVFMTALNAGNSTNTSLFRDDTELGPYVTEIVGKVIKCFEQSQWPTHDVRGLWRGSSRVLFHSIWVLLGANIHSIDWQCEQLMERLLNLGNTVQDFHDMWYRHGLMTCEGFQWVAKWWFQTFFIFTPTWGNDQIWLSFF